MSNRWWIYQKERFPLLGHGPLIAAFSFSAVSFSFLLRHGPEQGLQLAAAFGVAFVSSLLFFLQLRITDEFKDHEEDRRYRPYRPVPRGLVSLRELAWAAAAASLVQLLLAWWWAGPLPSPDGNSASPWFAAIRPGLPGLLLVVWLYLALMSREFFVRHWIKSRPITYMWTHMLIMPLVDFYATACEWMGAAASPPRGLFWFLVVSFFNGIVVEIGRKIRSPDAEETGVQTYTVLWGAPWAIRAWLGALILTAFCAWRAAVNIRFAGPVGGLLICLLAAALIIALTFLKQPTRSRARRLEHFSGVWTLLMYLGLGAVPLFWRPAH